MSFFCCFLRLESKTSLKTWKWGLSWIILLFDYSPALSVKISWTFLPTVLHNQLFHVNFIANYFFHLSLFKIRALLKINSVQSKQQEPRIQDQVANILNFLYIRARSSCTLYRMRRCCPGRNANNLHSMILLKKTNKNNNNKKKNPLQNNLSCNTFCIHKRKTGRKEKSQH